MSLNSEIATAAVSGKEDNGAASAGDEIEISVVLPCLNEQQTVGACVQQALGIGGSIFAVSGWARTSFGNLNPELMLRIVMPAVFSLTLGVQIVCSSFFLSILGLRRK